MLPKMPVVTVVNEIIDDYEYELQQDGNGIVRAYYRLCDSPHCTLRRIAGRDLPEKLKKAFENRTGCTREQLQI